MLQVVTGAVRQLQHLVCDDPPAQCTSMFLAEAKRGGAGGPVASAHRRLAAEQAYQKRSERLLQDENCFKVYTVSSIADGDPYLYLYVSVSKKIYSCDIMFPPGTLPEGMATAGVFSSPY